MGVIIETSGTQMGIWGYFNELGGEMFAPLAFLGMAYASVIAFSIWIVNLE